MFAKAQPWSTRLRGAAGKLGRAAALLTLFALCPGGCDSSTGTLSAPSSGNTTSAEVSPEQRGLELLAENLAQMPSASPSVTEVLPPTDDPAGTLFGLLLDNDTRAFILGDTSAPGEPTVTGVVFTDLSGALVFQQDLRDAGMKLTFARGDAVDLDLRDDGLHLVFTLNASEPPSTLAAHVDAAGNVTLDESATVFGVGERSDYGTAKLRLPRNPGGPKRGWRAAGAWECKDVGDWVLRIGNWACDLYDACTSALPGFAAAGLCNVFNNALDVAGSKPNITETEKRVLGVVKISTTFMCNALKGAVKVGELATKVNPLGAACLVLDYGDDVTTVVSGKSLAEQFCAAILGSAPPTPDPNASLGPPVICSWENPDGTSSSTPGTTGSVIEVSGDPAYPTYRLTISAIVQEFTVSEDTQSHGLFGANVCSPASQVPCPAEWTMSRTITYGDYNTTGGVAFTMPGIDWPNPAPALRPGHKIIVVFKLREGPFWKVAWLTYVMGSSAYCQ